MKKILFGSAAAICAVVGMSSFKAAKNSTRQTIYYFRVASGAGSTTQFSNSQLSTRYGTITPVDDCEGAGKKCIVGFTANQLNVNQTKIKTNALHQTLPQTNKVTLYTRTEA